MFTAIVQFLVSAKVCPLFIRFPSPYFYNVIQASFASPFEQADTMMYTSAPMFLGRESSLVTCPSCKNEVMTETSRKLGGTAYIASATVGFVGLFFCLLS